MPTPYYPYRHMLSLYMIQAIYMFMDESSKLFTNIE